MLPPQSSERGGDDPDMLAPLLDAEQVAALLGVPESWVRAQARAGRIPCKRLGRYIRFDARAVKAWVDEQ